MPPKRTVDEVADYLGANVVGDGTIVLTGVAPIEEAETGQLSFVANPKYISLIDSCTASALITSPALETAFQPRVLSKNPYLAFTKVMQLFLEQPARPRVGIAAGAQVHPEAVVVGTVTIQSNASVEAGAYVGENSILEPGVVLGRGAAVGRDCLIEANAVISPGSRIGDHCIIHAGTHIGGCPPDAPAEAESMAVLGDEVELGANVVIQGGPTHNPTQLGSYCKVDNLVNVGPECQIGPGSILVSQVTVGRGVTLGKGVTLAGQVTVANGCTIGDGAVVAAKSLVETDIPVGGRYLGVPAIPIRDEQRARAMIHRLPKVERLLEQIKSEQTQ